MKKIKYTKGELKAKRDSLKRYLRYLPTLMLKKQQLQIELLHKKAYLGQKKAALEEKILDAKLWANLLADNHVENFALLVGEYKTILSSRNIAGVDIPILERVDYRDAAYDLFLTPLWVDHAIVSFRQLINLKEEIKVAEECVLGLEKELKTAAQRVNLFEKVKIPDAEEAIRRIKIYIGDQMANAVGRSKIAKRKIETAIEEEIFA